MPRNSSLSQRPPHHPSFFNLAALALILSVVGLGVAYWLDANGKPSPPPAPSVFGAPFLEKTLAGTQLKIPTAWQNPATHINDKTLDFLDLILQVVFSENSDLQTINVHLTPSDQSQPSAQLLNSVYMLRFSQSQLNTISGLIGKPLRQEEGFQNETVWYDPIGSNPFVAKCIVLDANNTAPNCLRTVQLTPEISATYQFNESNLIHWRNFDIKLNDFISKIIIG